MWSAKESYSAVSLLSDVGGSMGLLLGLSIHSLSGLLLGMLTTALRAASPGTKQERDLNLA